MATALIVSLNFNPGHASHLIASYKQCEEIGYESYYYVHPDFIEYLPKNSRVCVYGKDDIPKAEVAFFLFPSQKNLKLILKLKSFKTKVIYVFHEPLAALKEYRKAGFSYLYLMKLWIINRISSFTVKWSNAIILPSKKAVALYSSNNLYKNKNYYYVPLMFDDERTNEQQTLERKYFSYIGTVAPDHSFQEYLDFVDWAIENNELQGMKFLVATKSSIVVPERLIQSGRIVIQQGKPMTNEQINEYYSMSWVIWNAYARTTQSGVLAKSFCFGTPSVVLKNNLSEFTSDGKEICAIEDNQDKAEIKSAVEKIVDNFNMFSDACRKRFVNTFYYRNHNSLLEDIINSSK